MCNWGNGPPSDLSDALQHPVDADEQPATDISAGRQRDGEYAGGEERAAEEAVSAQPLGQYPRRHLEDQVAPEEGAQHQPLRRLVPLVHLQPQHTHLLKYKSRRKSKVYSCDEECIF